MFGFFLCGAFEHYDYGEVFLFVRFLVYQLLHLVRLAAEVVLCQLIQCKYYLMFHLLTLILDILFYFLIFSLILFFMYFKY